MKITKASLYLVEWPFSLPVSHSLAENTATSNMAVRLTGENGLAGYGEGVARPYVTGEQTQDSLSALKSLFLPRLVGQTLSADAPLTRLHELFSPQLIDRHPAAFTALEIAVLDLAGRTSGRPLYTYLNGGEARPAGELVYSAVVPFLPPGELAKILKLIKKLDLGHIKLKLGRQDDEALLELAGELLGPGVDLRVDVNGAWGLEEALANLALLEKNRVRSLEQPLAKHDLDGLARLVETAGLLIMADESLCTMRDARLLIEHKAATAFNLRLCKCGGPSRTARLLALARKAGVKCQLGCHVGELGILSAAGRHFAQAAGDLIYLEGSLTRFFMAQDLIAEDLSPGVKGRAPWLGGPGLGVTVLHDRLAPCIVAELEA